MFARSTKRTAAKDLAEGVETPLTIPPKPSAIAETDIRWRTAVAERERAQEAHRQANARYEAQVPGAPLSITRNQVDEIGSKIAELLEAERIAAFARDQALADYQDQVNLALDAPIIAITAEIAEKTNEIEALLNRVVQLNADARAVGVVLSSRLPSAAGLIIGQGVFHLRSLINKFPTTTGK